MTKLKKLINAAILGISLSLATMPALAIISTDQSQSLSAVGNGVTTNYTIGFPFQTNSQITVYLQNQTTMAETLVIFGAGPGKYTISGGDPGTTVVMGTAPTSNFKVLIKRVTPRTQTVDYVPNQVFPADSHEAQMDRQVQMIQELNQTITDVQASTSSATADALSADPTDCSAGQKATAIDEQGNLTCSAVSMTADVSGVLPKANGGTGVDLTTTALELPEVATPSTPSSGFGKIYFKSDNKLYQVNDAGVESQVGSGAGGSLFNTLNGLNGDFEQGTLFWTASGGTFTSTTAAANIIPPSTTSGSWDSNGAGQTLSSSTLTVTSGDGISGQNVTGQMYLKCATGTCTHKLQLFDGTNVLAETTITSNTASFTPATVTTTAPASGSLILRLISVAANEPLIYIENAYRGRSDGFNLSQVSQASFYGSLKYAVTTNCIWSLSSVAVFTSFPADTDCPTPTVTGSITAPATKVPGVRLQNLPPGTYFFHVSGFFQKGNAAAEEYALRFFDGTNGFSQQGQIAVSDTGQTGLSGFVTYTTAQSDITIQLQAIRNGANSVQIRGDIRDFEISVYRFPSTTEQAVRTDQLPASWSGYHDSTCFWTRANTAYGDPTGDATCNLVEINNRNFGTVTSYLSGSDRLPGIVFTPSRPGRYLVLTDFSGAGTAVATVSYRMETSAGSLITEGSYVQSASSTNFETKLSLKGIVDAPSISPITIRIQCKASTGNCQYVSAGANSTISWAVIALDQSFPAPILTGSVVQPTSGIKADVWMGGTCSASSSITSDLAGTTIGNISGGTCTITLPSYFSSSTGLRCVSSGTDVSGTAIFTAINVSSATSVVIDVTNDSGGTPASYTFSAHCNGPR